MSSFKNPHIKIDLLLLPRGQNPLSCYILCNESKHNILALVGKANMKHWPCEVKSMRWPNKPSEWTGLVHSKEIFTMANREFTMNLENQLCQNIKQEDTTSYSQHTHPLHPLNLLHACLDQYFWFVLMVCEVNSLMLKYNPVYAVTVPTGLAHRK
jgi:hypothetical protein